MYISVASYSLLLLASLFQSSSCFAPPLASSSSTPPTISLTARHAAPSSYQQFIDGSFTDSTSTSTIEVENPSTHQLLSVVPSGTSSDADAALQAAQAAQPAWAATPAAARGAILKNLAALMAEKRDFLAATLAAEQAKVIGLAGIEVDASIEYLNYYAGFARIYTGEILQSDNPNEQIYLHRVPLGVSVGIVPWNFPVFVLMRKIAPALITGNTVVCKTSEFTPNASFEIAKLFHEAGVPPGVINIVTGEGNGIGQALVESKIPSIISMTGSVATGQKIMQAASQHLTKVNLELGGKAPAIVCKDCDLDLAVEKTWASRTIFSGQVCNCAERVYVDKSIFNEFTEKLASKMKHTVVGATPDAANADMCGLVHPAQLSKVQGMVERAKANGAEVVTGGNVNPNFETGYHFEPTALTNVQQSDEIVQQEIFGPVLPVLPFDDLEQALDYANDSECGLTSSIFTTSAKTVHRAMTALQFGETYINRHNFEAIQGYHAGWRKSGIGGTDGQHGLYECLGTRCVYWQE